MKKKTTKGRQLTARQVLAIIDEQLSRGTKQSGKLWDVLTAFRGPDGDMCRNKKSEATIPIRRAALPLTSRQGYSNNIKANFGYRDHTYIKQIGSTHFARHANNAALALKLLK